LTISVDTPARVDVWDFGGYPYALMPLVLPDPGFRSDSGDSGPVDCQLELMRTATEDPGDRAESVEELFWFRWITSNQAVAALWQILDDELELVLRGQIDSAAHNAALLLDGYSVMLVYAGSVTLELYHRLIRPAMALQHRSFTGRWAQDYVPVMAKLQTLRTNYRAKPRPDFIDTLIAASKRNHKAHVAVAAKLVPGEDSLLRANDGLSSLGAATKNTTLLYDAFYSTVRALVPRERIVEQLISRIRAMVRDLRTNGMYPAQSCSRDERPAEMWGDDLTELEDKGTVVLKRAAQAAAAALDPLPRQ
jgi:L-tyrosine peroxygenase